MRSSTAEIAALALADMIDAPIVVYKLCAAIAIALGFPGDPVPVERRVERYLVAHENTRFTNNVDVFAPLTAHGACAFEFHRHLAAALHALAPHSDIAIFVNCIVFHCYLSAHVRPLLCGCGGDCFVCAIEKSIYVFVPISVLRTDNLSQRRKGADYEGGGGLC